MQPKRDAHENDLNELADNELDLNSTVASLYYTFTAADWRTQTLEELLACPLCGSNLQFNATTNFAQLSVHEDAHCPSCQIRTKESLHRLQ